MKSTIAAASTQGCSPPSKTVFTRDTSTGGPLEMLAIWGLEPRERDTQRLLNLFCKRRGAGASMSTSLVRAHVDGLDCNSGHNAAYNNRYVRKGAFMRGGP